MHECPKPNKTKVKIKKWLDTPDLKRYETYICDWHYYLRDLKTRIEAHPEQMKGISMDVLQKFYLTPYDPTAEISAPFFILQKCKKTVDLIVTSSFKIKAKLKEAIRYGDDQRGRTVNWNYQTEHSIL